MCVIGQKVSKIQESHNNVFFFPSGCFTVRMYAILFFPPGELWCRDIDTSPIRSWGSFFGWAPTTPKRPPCLIVDKVPNAWQL